MTKQISSHASIQELKAAAEEMAELSHADAQRAIAREYGFRSWRQLEVFLLTHSPAERDNSQDNEPVFLQLACLNYTLDDRPSNWQQARQMLAEDPDIATQDIYHACCVGDVDTVAKFLGGDASLVNVRGGYFDWEPLMYACYSRLNLPKRSTLDVARLLIERGADANAHFMWGGQYKFTALTGVFGHGEGGSANLPEHEQCNALARLLLDAGAHPNDSQALYNRMFADNENTCVKMLLEYGLNSKDRCNWLLEDESGLCANPQQTLQHQLSWAVNNHHPERAKLLIDYGADLSTPEGNPSFYEAAMLAGESDLADYLVAHGAEKVALDSLGQFACVCMNPDEAKAHSLLDAEPDLMQRLQDTRTRLLHDAAAANRLDAVRLMADLGADLNKLTHNAPLHEAAWAGNVEMVKLLVARGADITLRDPCHFGTPLQWAQHSGNQPVVDFLATCEIDIFDAVACNNLARIASLLDHDPSQLESKLGDVLGKGLPGEGDWITPLAFAVKKQQPDAVRLLLERGANANLRDASGRSLLDSAKKEATAEIVTLLDRPSPETT